MDYFNKYYTCISLSAGNNSLQYTMHSHIQKELPSLTHTPGQAGWGIAWFINGSLIPELVVQRGRNYTFIVEGGDNPNILSIYHPFYITDSITGGRLRTSNDTRAVRILRIQSQLWHPMSVLYIMIHIVVHYELLCFCSSVVHYRTRMCMLDLTEIERPLVRSTLLLAFIRLSHRLLSSSYTPSFFYYWENFCCV